MTEPTRVSGPSRLTTDAVVLVAGRLSAAACGLIATPVVLHSLGTDGFGVWIAVVGLMWTFTAFDAGVGPAFQNRIATALASGRESDAAALVMTGARWFAMIALALATTALLPLWFGDWARWFKVASPGIAAQTGPAVWVAAATVVVALPFSFASRVAAAVQANWIPGFWTMLASFTSLAATLVCAWIDAPLAAFVAAAALVPVLPHVGTALHLQKRFRWLAMRPTAQPPGLAGVWRESALFFVPQVGAAFIASFVPTLAALFAGPAAAGALGVLQRLFGIGLQLQIVALQPTWPAYTHAAARSDLATAHRIYRKSWLLTLGAGVLPAIVLAMFWRPILDVWLRGELPPITPALAWSVGAWHVLQSLGQPPAMVLNGTGRIRRAALASIIHTTTALILCRLLAPTYGALGIVAGLALPYLALNLPIVVAGAHRSLQAMHRAAP